MTSFIITDRNCSLKKQFIALDFPSDFLELE